MSVRNPLIDINHVLCNNALHLMSKCTYPKYIYYIHSELNKLNSAVLEDQVVNISYSTIVVLLT